MMSLTFGLFTQMSGSGPLGPLVICHCYFLGLSVLYLCLLQNQSNYDLLNMRSLQRVLRCRQTNLVLDKGGVKISTRNRPLSP